MVENLLLWLAVLTCGLSCAALPAAAADPAIRPPARFVEVPATQQTLQSLRGGGFVLYLRHGHTAVIDTYLAHGRIRDGDTETMTANLTDVQEAPIIANTGSCCRRRCRPAVTGCWWPTPPT